MFEQEYDYLFKLLLIGNSSVGKSSLLECFVENTWDDSFVPNIGVDFVNDKLIIIFIEIKNSWSKWKKSKITNLGNSWTNKIEKYNTKLLPRGNGVLVVYDITNRESFENLNSWLNEIEKNARKIYIKY